MNQNSHKTSTLPFPTSLLLLQPRSISKPNQIFTSPKELSFQFVLRNIHTTISFDYNTLQSLYLIKPSHRQKITMDWSGFNFGPASNGPPSPVSCLHTYKPVHIPARCRSPICTLFSQGRLSQPASVALIGCTSCNKKKLCLEVTTDFVLPKSARLQ